jgi:hypothetical protein
METTTYDPHVRRQVEAGVETETRASRVFNMNGWGGLSALQHLIEPRATYLMIRGFDQKANPQYDPSIDRIGRGTIHVEACCMSMLGGIQPGRLRSYLVDALQDGPSNDGLIQRFQLLVWPDTPADWNSMITLRLDGHWGLCWTSPLFLKTAGGCCLK